MHKDRAELFEKLLIELGDVSEIMGSDYALRKNDPIGKLLRENPIPFLDAFNPVDLIESLKSGRYFEGVPGFENPKTILDAFGVSRERVRDAYDFSDPEDLDSTILILLNGHGAGAILESLHAARMITEPGYFSHSRPVSLDEIDI